MIFFAFLFLLSLFFSSFSVAQAPARFTYQAVARDNSGALLKNTPLDVRLSLLQGSDDGTAVWSETHEVTTNDLGLFSLAAGSISPLTVDWSAGPWFLKVELDTKDGNGFRTMGVTEFLSVPYALYAKDVENKDDADADPTNEIQDLRLNGNLLTLTRNGAATAIDLSPYLDNTDAQQLSLTGHTLSLSGGNTVQLPDMVNDADHDPTNEIQDLRLNGNILTITKNGTATAIDLSPFLDNPGWVKEGDTLSYPGSLAVGAGPAGGSKLTVQGDDLQSDSALFIVKRKDGQPVFAVYNEGVRVYVDDTPSKRPRGGFAIGGFGFAKGEGQEYMRVTPDSVRIYIDNSSSKRPRGGFAIGGFGFTKGTGQDYFNVSGLASAEVIHGENRVMWYPRKNAFLVGRVLIESPDNVGTNSFAAGYEPQAAGEYSQALGYKANAIGDNATAIGNNARALGNESYAFGNYAITGNQGSYAIGSGAKASGLRSFAVGSVGVDSSGTVTAPTQATGDYAYAFGMGSMASGQGAFAFGTQDTASGGYSLAMGYLTKATNWYSTAMGWKSKASEWCATAMGRNTTASGYASVAMGWETVASSSGAFAMGDNTTASGWSATAMGRFSKASGGYSTAMGYGPESSGYASTAIGWETKATNIYTTALGIHTIASGEYATALGQGSKATNSNATAMGFYTTASGKYSTASGYNTTAQAYGSFVIGEKNIISGDSNNWVSTDPLFVIGNGTWGSPHNAMTVLKNGEVYFPDVYGDAVGATHLDLYIDNSGKIGYLSSSRRYKKEIRPMENVNWLYHLRPVNFTYKSDKAGIKQYGLIAEEVEKVNPLFVSYNDKGQVETVQYSQLITPMLKALQEQRDTIIAMQKKIDRLEAGEKEIASLKKRIRTLETLLNTMAAKK